MSNPSFSTIDFVPSGWVESNSTSFLSREDSGSITLHGDCMGLFWVDCIVTSSSKPYKEKQSCAFSTDKEGKINSAIISVSVPYSRFSQLIQTLNNSKDSMKKLSVHISLAEKRKDHEFDIANFSLWFSVGEKRPKLNKQQ